MLDIVQFHKTLVTRFNPLQPGVAFLYPLKTSENLKVSDVFRGYRKATPSCNGLTDSVLHFVINGIPLKTRHIRANQAPYTTTELSKAKMRSSRRKNIYLKTKAQEDKKITINKRITVSNF